MTLWTITEQETGGQFIVSWGRKTKRFSSEDEAMGFVKDHRASGDRVIRVEKDGYRTPVTRRRWRRAQ